MNDTMLLQERLREAAKNLKQPTTESTKKFDKELAEMVKKANENFKAGRWHNKKL